jgi:hypothetical protein
MAKSTENATSEGNQKVESDSKDTSAKKENIESPEEKEFTLSDEQWEKVFQHPRFAKLNERAKEAETELKKLEKQKEKELQEKLKEEGKYQELLEEKEKELEQLNSSLAEYKLNNEVFSIANSLNVVDTDAVVKLLDRSKLETDKNGDYINLEEVVKELISEKPYLAKAGSDVRSNIGSNANATTESQSGDFVITKSELRAKLQDHNWYIENKDNIAQWEKEGRIDYSR